MIIRNHLIFYLLLLCMFSCKRQTRLEDPEADGGWVGMNMKKKTCLIRTFRRHLIQLSGMRFLRDTCRRGSQTAQICNFFKNGT